MWETLIPIAVNLLGNAIGASVSANDRERAEEAMKEALAEIDSISASPNIAKEILFQKFEVAGVLTPQIEKAIEFAAPKLAEVQTDPALRKAQLGALSKFQQMSETGLTTSERMQRDLASAEAERKIRGEEQSALSRLRAMGLSGGGATARTMLGRSADERARLEYELSARQAAEAEQRQLQAISQTGQLAGQIRSQEFGEKSKIAEAKDAFNTLTTKEQLDRQNRDIARDLQAQQFNIQNKQQLSNLSKEMAYREQVRQANAKMAMAEYEMQRKKLRADARMGKQKMAAAQAAGTQKSYGDIASSLANLGLTAYGGSQGWFKPDSTTKKLPGLSSFDWSSLDDDSDYSHLSELLKRKGFLGSSLDDDVDAEDFMQKYIYGPQYSTMPKKYPWEK